MKTRSLLAAIAAGAALLAACGSDSSSSPATTAAATGEATTAPAPAGSSTPGSEAAPSGETPVTVTDSALGAILTDASGRTLYGFTNDASGEPTCEGGCADAWPPVLIEGDALPAGLDAAVFTVVERPDDTYQLKAGDWPLYRFSGDAAPGQTNGQGSGGSWFVVGPDGALIKT